MSERTQAPPDDGADDLEILHPEREIEIAGVKVTMREYGFVEGMRLAGKAAPIVHDIKGLSADVTGAGLEYSALEAVFATHADTITDMVAQACDQPVEWVRTLPPEDGENLIFTWWAVNGPFFVRRLLRDLAMRVAGASAGATSTPVSRQPATVTKSGSDAAPTVN